MSKTKKVLFYAYDACGTCKKAKKWLDERGIAYEAVPIVAKPPTAAELDAWIRKSEVPARKWFNTSGQSYRALVAELGKDKVAALTEAEIVERLSRDGKLIKRPVLVADDRVLVGFKEDEYESLFG